MTRIAIISCDQIRNEGPCTGGGCLKHFNRKTANFERYREEDLQLVGFGTCGGCTGDWDEREALGRIKPLVEICDAQKIHFSTCMVMNCPHMEQYKKVIRKNYPRVETVMGTDAYPGPHSFPKKLTGPAVKKSLFHTSS